MRVLILALSVLGILVSADAAKAGLSTTTRNLSVSVDPATFTDEATQETEDQIGLDKGKRRAVQRRLHDGPRGAVPVNDFGPINIDTELGVAGIRRGVANDPRVVTTHSSRYLV
jgi:hypothetical protein